MTDTRQGGADGGGIHGERAWRLRGVVQGVGFRWWVRRTGLALGVEGWVRNEPDGSVSVHVRGSGAQLDAMERALARGPGGARVREMERAEAELEGVSGFEIRS
jgi:acylphosphatase